MEILFLTIGVSIAMALVFLAAFFWATKSGQYDDNYSPAVRILFDDEINPEPNLTKKQESNGN